MRHRCVAGFWITFAGLCFTTAAGAPKTLPPSVLHILFVGNSLTYTNDMPSLVGQVAELDGQRIEIATVAFPNFSLEDHLVNERTLAALGSRPWDVVVLQQGPSALESSRRALIRDTRALARLVRKSHTKRVALLMVWPAHSRSGDFERVAESYRMAAEAVDGLLIPAGAVWHKVLREHEIELYSGDGFHPSEVGSYLTALVVYRNVIGPLPRALQMRGQSNRTIGLDLSATEQRILFDAVEGFAQSVIP